VGEGYAVAQPGVFYRDFEKATLKRGFLLPSFPASRELAALGGMVANNAGGEKTLSYGKTNQYIKELKVILRDGNEYILRPLAPAELKIKLKETGLEGEIYRRVYSLIQANADLIESSRPKVSKNSAGYALWDVWNKEKELFDLSQLFVGSQGTLGLISEIKFGLVRPKPKAKMLVIFLRDFRSLGRIVNIVLGYQPETFESYDHHTLKLAIRFLPQLIKLMKGNIFLIAWKFLPEIGMMISGGLPKLILTAEFSGDTEAEAIRKAKAAREALKEFGLTTRLAQTQIELEKYHWIRRESFNLLRHQIKNKQTAPFIDDIIVPPQTLPDFLPQLEDLLNHYQELTYTIAGHIGDGNFHIIPLMDLNDPRADDIIHELTDKVYKLVFQYGGSMTAEHNDGLIRSPYLKQMYGEKIYQLFEEVKRIFDPDNIFNPGKKVGASLEYALAHLKHSR
jgi:FAD/FMN-containing dehydrogenase